jgi:tetratricopeptide (TPR) repeat protein
LREAWLGSWASDLDPGVVTSRRPPTRNVAAYELYLRGSDRSLVRTDSGLLQGMALFQQAIALDSTYAAAWAGLGRMYNVFSQYSTIARPARVRYRALAEEASRRAVALDNSLAEAHQTLGAIRLYRLDLATAEHHLARALTLDPSRGLTHEVMVRLLLWTGRPAQALAHAERALQLDPLSAPRAATSRVRSWPTTDATKRSRSSRGSPICGRRSLGSGSSQRSATLAAHGGRKPSTRCVHRPNEAIGTHSACSVTCSRAPSREKTRSARRPNWSNGA